MAIKLRKRYTKPSRDYQILSIAMTCNDDKEAVQRIIGVLHGDDLTEREERIIASLFSEPDKIVTEIRRAFA